jgi:hypothetical protein
MVRGLHVRLGAGVLLRALALLVALVLLEVVPEPFLQLGEFAELPYA